MDDHEGITTVWLGAMDSVYLICYAIGNMISGYLEDHTQLRYLIAGGLGLSGLIYGIIIALGYLDIYIAYIFLIQWAFQGISQSAVFPGTVAVIGNWFSAENRGKIMGVWSTGASVGNIFGALIGGFILNSGQEWMVLVLVFALFEIFIAIVYFFTVKDHPPTSKVSLVGEHENNTVTINSIFEIAPVNHHTKKALSFMEALKLFGVIPFSLNYACIKSLYYGLSMWLPYFLHHRISQKSWIGFLAASLNVGAVIGSFACGWLGDKLGKRSPIIVIFLLMSIPCLILLEVGNDSLFFLYFIVIPFTGFCIGGAANIVTTAVAADLAQNPNLEEGTEAIATVAGIVDGAGGIGASISTFTMGVLSEVSWFYVFAFMDLIGAFAILSILHIFIRDVRDIKRRNQNRISN